MLTPFSVYSAAKLIGIPMSVDFKQIWNRSSWGLILSKGSIYNEVMGTGDRNEKSSLGLGASICILGYNTKMSLILFKFKAPNVGTVWGALIILRKTVCYNYPLPCTPGFKTVSFSKSRIPRIAHSYSHYKKYSF